MSSARLLYPALFALAAVSCRKASPDEPCGHAVANVPAFELSIVSSAGRPVTAMRITVTSGNSPDVYESLESTCNPASSLVCFLATRGDLCTGDGGARSLDGGSEVTCDLWLQGNADLTIEADGFAASVEHLELVQDSCKNTQTKSVRIDLAEPG